MNVHFISGLPRSGSTLLCAILRQNPAFHASMTSPVYSLCSPLIKQMSGASQYSMFFTDEVRRRVLKGLFSSYYAGHADKSCVIDTNRVWTGRAAMLADMFPEHRVICCVRDIGWVLDSIERMLKKNPLQTSRLFNFEQGASAYARAESLMDLDKGFIGHCWTCLREAWFSDFAGRLVLVEYEKLCKQPREVVAGIYQALRQPSFGHDFDRVIYDEPDYDAVLGMPGMHRVEEKVAYKVRKPQLPPDLLSKYNDLSFWKRPEFQNTGVAFM